MKFNFLLVTTTIVFLFCLAAAQAAKKPRWGKVICASVAEADAIQFATKNPFLDNWDYASQPLDQAPPYVAPKGTLACTLPVQIFPTTDLNGGPAFELEVNFVDQPFHLDPCVVTYYDHSRTRRFKPDGGGHGYVDLVPGSNDFDLTVSDMNQTRYQSDDFTVVDIGRKSQISWAGESRDSQPHAPIVTSCHLEF